MLKVELEKALLESKARVLELERIIKKYTELAVKELDPCDDGLELIDNVLREAKLPERRNILSMIISVDLPASLAKRIYDNGVNEKDVAITLSNNKELYPVESVSDIEIEDY